MEYLAPKTLSEALVLIRRWRINGKLVAGGTNVLPDMRANIRPRALVDLSHLKNLSFVKEKGEKIQIGALTTISELASSEKIRKYAAILSEAANQFGNPLVRNRATVGGNLADGSPAADTAVPLLVLDAMIVTQSNLKMREIPINHFFVGPHKTALQSNEIIKEIVFTKPNPHAKMAYAKLGLRNAMAISVASIALLIEMNEGKCIEAKIALGAVAPKPIRAYQTEVFLKNKVITEEVIESCCKNVSKEISPITDIRASADYRKDMASVLLKKLIKEVTV